MKLSEEKYKKIQDCGYFDYTAEDVYEAMSEFYTKQYEALNLSKEEFIQQFNDSSSIIYQTYQYYPTIKRCGALEYPVAVICKILDIQDRESFASEFNDENSKIRRKYDQGLLESRFKADSALKSDAETGNRDAIKLFDYKKHKDEVKDMKKQFFGI